MVPSERNGLAEAENKPNQNSLLWRRHLKYNVTGFEEYRNKETIYLFIYGWFPLGVLQNDRESPDVSVCCVAALLDRFWTVVLFHSQ